MEVSGQLHATAAVIPVIWPPVTFGSGRLSQEYRSTVSYIFPIGHYISPLFTK